MESIHDTLMSALQARRGQWRRIAEACEVPYHTLNKIARGQVKNPRIRTVEKILRYLHDVEC